MSLWKIAWRSIQQRSLASSLTAVSMGLGVALVVMVLLIHHVIDQSFRRSIQGFNLVVGAKGGRLELVLSTVYHFGQPPGTIPYAVYKELTQGALADAVEVAIPIAMGDNYVGYPVIGTVPERFTKLQYLEGREFQFYAGRNLDPDHLQEAVIGWQIAQKTDLVLGKEFEPAHGMGDAGKDAHKHEPFKVVGVLARTGTPVDRAIFVNIEAFYHMAGHGNPAADKKHAAKAAAGKEKEHGDHKENEAHAEHADHDHDHEEVPDEAKQVTAVLVCTKPATALNVLARLNRTPVAQAVRPAMEIDTLLEGVVGNIKIVLVILAVIVVIVAGIGMLVSMYNSMSERRHEIAIMRALGASRATVMLVVLWESILLSLAGGAIGIAIGHGVLGLCAPLIADSTGLPIEPWQFLPTELVLIPALVGLAAVIGYLPAVVAYRTDVAKSLART